MFISTNGGATWSNSTWWLNSTTKGDIRWRNVAVSSDGTKIIASPATGYVYVSLDQVDSSRFRAWQKCVAHLSNQH